MSTYTSFIPAANYDNLQAGDILSFLYDNHQKPAGDLTFLSKNEMGQLWFMKIGSSAFELVNTVTNNSSVQQTTSEEFSEGTEFSIDTTVGFEVTTSAGFLGTSVDVTASASVTLAQMFSSTRTSTYNVNVDPGHTVYVYEGDIFFEIWTCTWASIVVPTDPIPQSLIDSYTNNCGPIYGPQYLNSFAMNRTILSSSSKFATAINLGAHTSKTNYFKFENKPLTPLTHS